MARTKKPAAGKVIDVTAPGKSAPSASGRPIIVTNRPVIKRDPMVAGTADTSSDVQPKTEFKVPTRIKLEPISPLVNGVLQPDDKPMTAPELPSTPSVKIIEPATDTTTDDAVPVDVTTAQNSKSAPPLPATPSTPAAATEISQTESSATDVSADPSADHDSEQTKEPVATDSKEPQPQAGDAVGKPDSPEVPTESSIDDQAAPNKSIEDAKQKQADAEAERRAAQEKIIASKQYFLPIDTVERRRGVHRAVLALLIVLLLAVVWLDVVLDAGIVRLGGLQPVTDFFSN